MIAGFAIANGSGKILFSRDFRPEGWSGAIKELCDTVIRKRDARDAPPLQRFNGTTVAFREEGDVYLIATTAWDANAAMLLEVLKSIGEALRVLFGVRKLKVDVVQSRIGMIYTLLDEMIDYGYPQITSGQILQRYMEDTKVLTSVAAPNNAVMPKRAFERVKSMATGGPTGGVAQQPTFSNPTLEITGAVPWRKPGLVYKNNEVWMDIIETINCILTPEGNLVSGDVVGKIAVKAQLSGMPACKIGLNDKLSLQFANSAGNPSTRFSEGVNLEGVSLHQCVRLTDFESKREISFIPPDGDFNLITYRMADNIQLPFKLTTSFKVHGRTRVEIGATLQTMYDKRLVAYNVRVHIPLPSNHAKCNIKSDSGRCKVDKSKCEMRWKYKELEGSHSATFRADVTTLATTTEKEWEKPPIKVTFELPGFAASGLRIRFFHVFDTGNYVTKKWVRYTTNAGGYQIRF